MSSCPSSRESPVRRRSPETLLTALSSREVCNSLRAWEPASQLCSVKPFLLALQRPALAPLPSLPRLTRLLTSCCFSFPLSSVFIKKNKGDAVSAPLASLFSFTVILRISASITHYANASKRVATPSFTALCVRPSSLPLDRTPYPESSAASRLEKLQ